MKIGFCGLGKLGLPVAEAMAEHHDVVGYDLRPNRAPFQGTLGECVWDSKFIFVAVQTPHDPAYGGEKPTSHLPLKDFDYEPLRKCLRDIAEYIEGDHQRVVVISTCLPGVIDTMASILPCPLIYNPYFIAMGSVKRDFLNPEMMVLGGEDESALRELRDFYMGMVNTDNYIFCSWAEAAAIKVFFNTFVSARISLVNMILDISEAMGMDAGKICHAFTLSKKQKEGYWMPGMGDGGPCHPRDNIALRRLSERLGLGYDLFGPIMEAREKQAQNLARKLVSFGNPVVILGRSFKPGTDLTDGSYSMLVGHYVEEMGQSIVYDETPTPRAFPRTYLLGHYRQFHDYPFVSGSVVVDPWGDCPNIKDCRVYRYGRGA